jgi:anti-sigma B factor antagonist
VEHLGFDISTDGGTSLVTVRGEIDAATAPDLREAIMLVHQCTDRDVTLDLAHVAFMDSSGIAALIHVQRDLVAMGHCLKIQNAHGHVERILWITGATEYLAPDVALL